MAKIQGKNMTIVFSDREFLPLDETARGVIPVGDVEAAVESGQLKYVEFGGESILIADKEWLARYAEEA